MVEALDIQRLYFFSEVMTMKNAYNLENGTYRPGCMREALFEFEMLKDGYWVDLKGFETCVLQGLSEESSREILESYRELALEHFCFVRIENTSNFRFKINLSEWCGDKMRAIQMGKNRELHTIWDIENSQPVYLKAYPFTAFFGKHVGGSPISKSNA